MRTLFITRDGPGLTYLESLFVPIFRRLADHGFPFDVLQFRWGETAERQSAERACREAGIGYRSVRVWRRPAMLGPFASALGGQIHVRRAVKHFGSQAVMPRGSLAALSVPDRMLADGLAMIYDADGLDIDERVDFAGLPSTGPVYRLLRDSESQAVRRADRVLVRTDAQCRVMINRAGPPIVPARFQVVTNGRDEGTFHPQTAEDRAAVRASLSIDQDVPLLVYVGTVGYRQHTSRVWDMALAMRRACPTTRLLILTGSPDEARALLKEHHPALEAFTTVLRIPHDEVPRYLAAADIGTAFVRESFSTQGISPLKTAEYLLCGVPVIGTAQIGNNSRAMEAGLFFDEQGGLDQAAHWALNHVLPNRTGFRERARRIGVEQYSLARAVKDYAEPLRAVRNCIAGWHRGGMNPARKLEPAMRNA